MDAEATYNVTREELKDLIVSTTKLILDTNYQRSDATEQPDDLDNSEALDPPFTYSSDRKFFMGFYNPYTFGKELAAEWLETASIAAIHEAASRMTTNQQIRVFFKKFSTLREEGADPIEDNISLSWPTDDPDISAELTDFYKQLKNKYFYFDGYPDDADPFLTRPEHIIINAPNNLFREFEDGFTENVRYYYKTWLSSNSTHSDEFNL